MLFILPIYMQDQSGTWYLPSLLVTGNSCCLVAQSCLTLCNPMDCSTPGFPVLHYLPEFVQPHSTESMMPSNHLILVANKQMKKYIKII